ncbi:hypothetical protein Ami103574_14490 [Aminipila butyrica]|uniref:DUF4440 domain-containing protein n=1 Tax=Aminipila butyrica TaxID=433296 RepID=A0A858C1K1_9FIRM|nr:hypothetical protein [Aminipila butyrica]QIB70426.1 hypothetical protein Ami103574_14490 [Aminipila butyrica]
MDNLFKVQQIQQQRIRHLIEDFYKAYCQGDTERMYSCLDWSFQNHFSLEVYKTHSSFDVDIGLLIEVQWIEVQKEEARGLAQCLLDIGQKIREMVLVCRLEEGGWKMDGRSLYKRR